MEQQSQTRPGFELPPETYQWGEDYELGCPLAVYNTRERVLRRYKMLNRLMLGTAIGVFLIGLMAVLVYAYQLQLLKSQHPLTIHDALLLQTQTFHIQDALIESLIPLFLGFLYAVGALVQMRIVARGLPASLLVYTGGLLEVCPKKVDVTRWEDVTGLLRVPGMKKRKSYRLSRRHRKALIFGEALEDVEGLVNQIRQYIPQRHDIK
ncbi:MAG: hypothetical protein H0U76_25640 [Ktedonobacteraceae bacterium]|nr:hypothetical protein [Ktedonobacteraceae bacterium]